jgi:hypothetical protein
MSSLLRLIRDKRSQGLIRGSNAIHEGALLNQRPMKPTKLRVTFGTLFPGPGTEALVVEAEGQEHQQGGVGHYVRNRAPLMGRSRTPEPESA